MPGLLLNPMLISMSKATPSSSLSVPLPAEPVVSRTTSYAGQKRSRQADALDIVPPRRTKSTGDARMSKAADDGYKRGIIRTFVRTALEQVSKGNDGPYQELVSHFLPTPTAPVPDFNAILPLLQAISSSVALLTPLHSSLVEAIISLPWAIADERFVRSYIALTGTLASARPEWVGEIATKAVKGLTWHKAMPVSPVLPSISRRVLYSRYHNLIRHLLELIPTLPTVLQPILLKHFPWKKESEVEYVTYIRNVLDVVEYCSEVSGKVWEGVIDRLIRLDVEIQTELEDVDEDEDDEMLASSLRTNPVHDDPLSKLVSEKVEGAEDSDEEDGAEDGSEVDIEDLSSEEGSASESDEDEEKLAARMQALAEMKAKLDSLIFYFLQHLRRIFVGPSSSTSTPAIAMTRSHHFQTLLSIFDRLILPTFQCRRVQFIFFWCCSLDAQYTELFLGLLVSKALFEQAPAVVTRVAAAGYVSSLVSRAQYVDDGQARKVAAYLLAYIDGELLEAREDPQGMASNGTLPVFYAVCQAMMMIFCFRWHAFEIRNEGQDTAEDGVVGDLELEGDLPVSSQSKWMKDLEIYQKAVFSNLNPLMACYPAVVDMFAKIAHSTNFMFCYSKMEANRIASAAVSGSGAPAPSDTLSAGGMTLLPLLARQTLIDTGLESYFPFDPYDLPRSKEWVDAVYRKWEDVPRPAGMADDDAEAADEQDATDASDVGEDQDGMSLPSKSSYLSPGAGFSGGLRTGRSLLDGEMLSTSMEGMRISPRTSVLMQTVS